MQHESTSTTGKYIFGLWTARSGRPSTRLDVGEQKKTRPRRLSMKKLTLATVALWTLFGVADIVSAQSDPDPVEPDTPGRCGDGDVGDSFATAYDLGNVETWPTPDNGGAPGDKVMTVVSEFECSGDLDVYRFQISSLTLIVSSGYLSSFLVNVIELYDSGGNFVGSRDGSGRQADLFPGIYYVAVANQPLAEHRTETGRYEFTLENWALIQEIQPTTARSPGGPVAVLMNLSPWQAWVHLYCQKDRPASDDDPAAPCTVRFECNGMSGEPASWTVNVAPKTIFSYWPNKMANGTSANLQAALMEAGKTEDEARRRTMCEVFSPDPLAVRGYTLFGGQPTLVPVAVY